MNPKSLCKCFRRFTNPFLWRQKHHLLLDITMFKDVDVVYSMKRRIEVNLKVAFPAKQTSLCQLFWVVWVVNTIQCTKIFVLLFVYTHLYCVGYYLNAKSLRTEADSLSKFCCMCLRQQLAYFEKTSLVWISDNDGSVREKSGAGDAKVLRPKRFSYALLFGSELYLNAAGGWLQSVTLKVWWRQNIWQRLCIVPYQKGSKRSIDVLPTTAVGVGRTLQQSVCACLTRSRLWRLTCLVCWPESMWELLKRARPAASGFLVVFLTVYYTCLLLRQSFT